MWSRAKAVAALAAASAMFCACDAYARAYVCSDFTGGVAQRSTRDIEIPIVLQAGQTVTITITDGGAPVQFTSPVSVLVPLGQSLSYSATSAGNVQFSGLSAADFLSTVTCAATAASSGSTQTQPTQQQVNNASTAVSNGQQTLPEPEQLGVERRAGQLRADRQRG